MAALLVQSDESTALSMVDHRPFSTTKAKTGGVGLIGGTCSCLICDSESITILTDHLFYSVAFRGATIRSVATVMLRCLLRMLLIALTLIASTLSVGLAFADERLALTPALQGRMLGRSMQYLVDTDGALDLAAVMAKPPRDWQSLPDEVANFGLTTEVYWFRLPLTITVGERANDGHDWLLEISYSLLDQVDFYLRDDGAVNSNSSPRWQQSAGLRQPFEERLLPHRFLLFPLPSLQTGEYTIYLRVHSLHAMQVPAALWHVDDYLWRDESHNIVVGLLAGAMLVMLVYNLLLYSVVRDPIYLYYTGVVIAVLLLQFGMLGIGVRHFWPHAPDFAAHSVLFGGLMSTYSCARFTVAFLQLKERGHILYRPYFFLGQFSLAMALLSLFAPTSIMVLMMVLCALTGGLMATLILTNVWGSNERPVRIFAVGWTVLITGVLLLALNKLGLLPMNFFTEQMVSVGILIQLVLFSMALGDRINFEKQQTLTAQRITLATLASEHQANTQALKDEERTRQAQETTLRLRTQSNAELEREIDTRTRELSLATEQLREISRVDALTGLYNRREFNERLDTEHGRAMRAGTALSLVLLDVDHFKAINDSYGHAAGDDCLRFFAALTRDMLAHEAAIVCRYGGEEFALLLPGYTSAGACVLAERVRLQLSSQYVQSQNRRLRLTVSAGIAGLAASDAGTIPARTLVERADRALYEAKAAGRNCVREAS
jgi:two-component system, sensor histidine kinase LadS